MEESFGDVTLTPRLRQTLLFCRGKDALRVNPEQSPAFRLKSRRVDSGTLRMIPLVEVRGFWKEGP